MRFEKNRLANPCLVKYDTKIIFLDTGLNNLVLLVLLVGVLSVITIPTAFAEKITFGFKGKITDLEDPNGLVSGIQVGDVYEGTVDFDSLSPDINPDSTIGSYRFIELEMRFGAISFVTDPPPHNSDIIFVNNNQFPNKDAFGIQSFTLKQQTGPNLPPFITLLLDLIDNEGTVFSDTALPITPPPIVEFEEKLMFFILENDVIIEGNVESLFLLQPVGGEFIPLDTTALLLAGTYSTAAWMIPVIVSGIGFAIVIARKF